jgi:hypothetical protein
MRVMTESSLPVRLRNFVLAFGATCAFIYVFLPLLTQSCPILHRMSLYLADNGIDPTRYYYTDVEQVKESENYLRLVLDDK